MNQDYNAVDKRPFSHERENKKLCAAIVDACRLRGMDCHKEIKLGSVNPYGSRLNTDQLTDYLSKINEFAVI